ncbi:MAG: OmpH family outer membrane protein [Erythrobacter sp.]|uniref:OmpH family outer membrane protein n=1 Tax=Erythrobacter sp. TaxID=1042 RepID=UPI003265B29F
MTRFTKTLRAAGLAACAVFAAAAPANAQVEGRVATADVASSILGTTAFQTASSQINTTYSAQIQQLQTKQQELSQLILPFDTDNNGQLDEAEQNAMQSAPSFSQIQSVQGEIAGLTSQVNGATIFAVEQILVRYSEALSEVVQQQQIVMLIAPETVQFVAEGGDISPLVSASLNAKIPTVQIVPPADWRPSRQGAQVTQTIQQMLVAIRQQAAQQQAQQQAQQPAAAPSGR